MARPYALLLVALAAVGCHHDKHNLAAKIPDEYVLPPSEARFDQPPQSEYRKPPPKKDFMPGGGLGNNPGGFSNPGSGGRGFNGASGF